MKSSALHFYRRRFPREESQNINVLDPEPDGRNQLASWTLIRIPILTIYQRFQKNFRKKVNNFLPIWKHFFFRGRKKNLQIQNTTKYDIKKYLWEPCCHNLPAWEWDCPCPPCRVQFFVIFNYFLPKHFFFKGREQIQIQNTVKKNTGRKKHCNLLETVPVLLVGRELGQQLQILEVVEALEHRAQQQLYTQRENV